MPEAPSAKSRLSRGSYQGLGTVARLAAAFLTGALICLSYFVGISTVRVAIVLVLVAFAFWLFSIVATKHVRVPWYFQAAAITAGFLAAGYVVLLITFEQLADE